MGIGYEPLISGNFIKGAYNRWTLTLMVVILLLQDIVLIWKINSKLIMLNDF